ncbi:hypothetical protein P153DRAFT_293102, partial [Dothidotthia symphoricarpi CBS 119687]
IMNSTSEKTPLLPITERAVSPHREPLVRKSTEFLLLLLCVVLAVLQFFVHFNFCSPESRLGAHLDLLARGLTLSVPASLPTTTILFVAAPWIARPDRIAITRYAILSCYVVGSTLGAWLLTRDLQVGSTTRLW